MDGESHILVLNNPNDFGGLNGTNVSNKDTLFQELDDFLGRSPSVEYILVRPL